MLRRRAALTIFIKMAERAPVKGDHMGIFRSAVMALAAGKLVPAPVRRLVLTASRIFPVPFGFLVDVGCLERPAHAYCMWHAAQLA